MLTTLLSLSLLLLRSLVHGCGYEAVKNTEKAYRPDPETVQIMGVDPITKRAMAGATRNLHSYRLGVYYTNLDNFIASNPSLSSKSEMSKRILDRCATYINSYIQVNFFDTMSTNAITCGTGNYPALSGNYDFLLLVAPENNSGTPYFAAASPCADDTLTGRPVVGSYNLNFAFLNTPVRTEYTLFFVFMHELTHLLGFMQSYYTKYRKSDGVTAYTASEAYTTATIGGQTFTLLKYPDLLTFAKSYYGCSTLTGVPVENDGGSGSAGSHWEKTFLPNEYMNPSVEDYPIISEFTTTVLKSTGWYTMSSTAAQPYTWGQNGGCTFFSICPTVAGYCPMSSVGNDNCAQDFRSKAYCSQSSTFHSTCGVIRSSTSICEISMPADQPVKTSTETYGSSSRCIEYQDSVTSKITPFCHQVSCSGTTLTITMATGTTYTCSSAGSLVSIGGTSSIKCPDPVDFCSKLSTKCSEDCYKDGQGICMKGGTCLCFKGIDSSGKCNPDPTYKNYTLSTGTGNDTSQNSTNTTNSSKDGKSSASHIASLTSLLLLLAISVIA